MKRIKVLHLISSPHDIGGAESLLLDMSRHYDRDRFEVVYSNLFADKGARCKFEERLDAEGLPSFNLPGSSLTEPLIVLGRLAKLLRAQRPDIVHTHLLHATFLGYLATRSYRRAKFVTSQHYTTDIFKNGDIHLARRTALRLGLRSAIRADRVYAVSGAVRDDLLANGCDPGRVETIHNGIDLEAFERREQASETIRDLTGPRLVTIGSLFERKGHDILLHALSRILEQIPQATLSIVGDGDQRDNLSALARDLKIEKSVVFAGFQTEPMPYLKNSDLYVHAARQEPFGIALLEAMAAGKCVVATAVGGAPEIVEENITGILVSPNDPKSFADAVIHMLGDAQKMAAMGAAGRQAVRKFDIRKVVSEYERSYARLLESA